MTNAPAERRGERGAMPGLGGLGAIDLARALPDPFIAFEAGGALVFANPAALAAFGDLPPGLLLQMKFRSPAIQALVEGAGGSGHATEIEYVERLPIERIFSVSLIALGEGGGFHALLFRDQSEARRIDRMRADFIANASHELRTPLASIAGFIETLRGPAREDAGARETFLQMMQAQTGRMARLIDDLLTLSRLEMKPLYKGGARLDMGTLVAEVVESLGHQARERGVEIVVDLPARMPAVAGSRDELIQVIANLTENAIKYGASGKRVEIGARQVEEAGKPELAVTVRDFGPGIPREHIPRVTERFYRIDTGTAPAQKGTGLGLSIVKHILTRHDGRLAIRSPDGGGASFTAYLPLD